MKDILQIGAAVNRRAKRERSLKWQAIEHFRDMPERYQKWAGDLSVQDKVRLYSFKLSSGWEEPIEAWDCDYVECICEGGTLEDIEEIDLANAERAHERAMEDYYGGDSPNWRDIKPR